MSDEAGAMSDLYEHVLFMPRWHGWAQWETRRYWPFNLEGGTFESETVAKGWTRRPRGSPYIAFGGPHGTQIIPAEEPA